MMRQDDRGRFDLRTIFRSLPGLTVFVFWLMAIVAAVYFEVRFLTLVNFDQPVMRAIVNWAGYIVLPLTILGFMYMGYELVIWIGRWSMNPPPKDGPPSPASIGRDPAGELGNGVSRMRELAPGRVVDSNK